MINWKPSIQVLFKRWEQSFKEWSSDDFWFSQTVLATLPYQNGVPFERPHIQRLVLSYIDKASAAEWLRVVGIMRVSDLKKFKLVTQSILFFSYRKMDFGGTSYVHNIWFFCQQAPKRVPCTIDEKGKRVYTYANDFANDFASELPLWYKWGNIEKEITGENVHLKLPHWKKAVIHRFRKP